MIRRVAREGLQSKCFPTIIVLGASYDQILPEIENLPVYVSQNQNWGQGISTSIKSGLHTLEQVYPECKAVILAVGDQPLINSKLLNELIQVFDDTGAPIVASLYEGVRGSPVLFGKDYYPRLQALTGDRGARKLIEEEPGIVQTMDFNHGDIDLDTPEDYLKFSQKD